MPGGDGPHVGGGFVHDGRGQGPKRDQLHSGGDALGRSPDLGVVTIDDRCTTGALLRPDLRLGPGIMSQVRVPVKVVGGEVQPTTYVRAERLGELELERGHLGHQHRFLAGDNMGDRLQQRVAHVACRHSVSSRGGQHGGYELGHRRLPVGARNRHQPGPSVLTGAALASFGEHSPRQLDLAPYFYARSEGRRYGRVVGPDPRARHDQTDRNAPAPPI